MEALYRTYRPKTFAELVGQHHIRAVLEGELLSGRIAHAYLFSGPRGVGKTSMARILAKAVNCEARKTDSPEPCGACPACAAIADGKTLDIIEIDAASHTGVDHVREEIIEQARFAPSRLRRKVFIIDEVHMLSASAFNALLKTLEEPPSHVMFILATTEIHKVPETIISRCQRFAFKRVPAEDIAGILKDIIVTEGVKVAKPVLLGIARLAEGCPRDAESLLGQVLALGEREITEAQAALVLPENHRQQAVEFIGLLASGNAAFAVQFVNQLVDDGIELIAFARESIVFLRELLHAKLGGEDAVVFEEIPSEIREMVRALAPQAILYMIDRLAVARRELERTEIMQLPLELAAVELCLERTPQTAAIFGTLTKS